MKKNNEKKHYQCPRLRQVSLMGDGSIMVSSAVVHTGALSMHNWVDGGTFGLNFD